MINNRHPSRASELEFVVDNAAARSLVIARGRNYFYLALIRQLGGLFEARFRGEYADACVSVRDEYASNSIDTAAWWLVTIAHRYKLVCLCGCPGETMAGVCHAEAGGDRDGSVCECFCHGGRHERMV